MRKRLRLGILASHPIQYQVPWFRYLAKRMEIEVFYAHRQDGAGQARAGFGVEFEWDIPLLNGYPHRWLKNVSRRPGLHSFWGCDTPEIYEVVRREKFDAFLVLGWNRKSFIQAIRACWKYRVPVLMRGDSHPQMNPSCLKSMVKYFPYRWFLPRLDAHLDVGKHNREYLEYYGVPKDRLFFCPHFVDNDFFQKGAEQAEIEGKMLAIRKQLNIPPDAFVFLFVGKLIPKKRPGDFIQACLNIFNRTTNIHALLVGDGPLGETLEQMARPSDRQIHFSGFRNQSELPAFYRASNALVLPSDERETWGLVVNEAFSCGIPALVSDAVGCAPDMIQEGRTGFTYPMGDTKALAERMLALKFLCEKDSGLVQSALAKKVLNYSIQKATEGLEHALDKVVRFKKKKMNVLVLGMGASAFGRERRAVSTSKHMDQVQPYFLISQWEDGSVSRLLEENNLDFGFAPFGYLGRAKPVWTLITILNLPRLYFEVLRAYFRNRCNIILMLCFHPLINAFLPVLFLKLLFRAKPIFYLGDIPANHFFHRLTARVVRWFGSRMIANSLAAKRGLVRLGIPEDRIDVVYNGVDLQKYKQVPARDLKREFGWPEDTFLIGFVGQLKANKGVMDFFESAKVVIRQNDRCRFLVIGKAAWDGKELAQEMSEFIRTHGLGEYITFLGWQSEIESIYKALDIVVVPSRHEDPAPSVNIEAMASGVPIVATRVGGTPELVDDGTTGFLVEKRNVNKLGERILQLTEDEDRRRKMGEAGKRRVQEIFDIQKNAALIESILSND